jgi:hypothetical protein
LFLTVIDPFISYSPGLGEILLLASASFGSILWLSYRFACKPSFSADMNMNLFADWKFLALTDV